MARKGENIYKRKDGRYEGRYIKGRHEDGKPKYGYIYGYEYGSVKKRLILQKAEQANKSSCIKTLEYSSLKDWIHHWLYKMALPNIKQSTFGCYLAIVNKHLLPNLGGIAMANLNAEMVQMFLKTLSEKNLSATTIGNIYRLLKAILEKAETNGQIQKNPCTGIRLPKKRKKNNKSFTKEERNSLISSISSESSDIQLEILLPLYTGLRVGELCALRMKDIDLYSSVLHIRETVQRVYALQGIGKTEVIIGEAKSIESQREIPIPPFLLPILTQKKETRSPNAFLLGSGDKTIEPRTVQRHLHKRLKQVGLRICGMHTLRHTFATMCLEAGADIVTISELLGHANTVVTYCYLHTNQTKKREVIGLL